MSYDYNKLVAQISSSRQLAIETNDVEEKLQHLQQATDAFAKLSSHCPMTPLLWMQYASDTEELFQLSQIGNEEALEARLNTLELGLEEFPGSAPLQLHYLVLLSNGCSTLDENDSRLKLAIEKAIDNVGRGSHRNEGDLIIASIYRLASQQHRAKGRLTNAVECFQQRAAVPMKNANDGIIAELEQFCADSRKDGDGIDLSVGDLQRLEVSRRNESRIYSALVDLEDDVDMAMHNEGVLFRLEAPMKGDDIDWDKILAGNNNKFWMGFGGLTTTNAFIKYAQACARFELKTFDETSDEEWFRQNEAKVKGLAISVYERGVAECPTAESLWISYVRHLIYLIRGEKAASKKDSSLHASVPSRLQSVVDRAVRNCPYSLSLYQQRLNATLIVAEYGLSVFDPDQLMKIVQEAIDAKFISVPAACLDLYLSAIQVAKRQLLSLLSQSTVASSETQTLQYDDAEKLRSKPPTTLPLDMDQSTKQDVKDLCEDIRDMYDAADTYLRKNHDSWCEGRAQLWADRGETETHLVSLLIAYFSNDGGLDSVGLFPSIQSDRVLEEVIRCFEKLTRIHQPAHPDSFVLFIRSFRGCAVSTSPAHIISRLRQVRGLFQRALKAIGRPKETSQALSKQARWPGEFGPAFHSFCQEYLAFEKAFGSEKSFIVASKAIQKKWTKFGPNVASPAAGMLSTVSAPMGSTASNEAAATCSTEAANRPQGSNLKVGEDVHDKQTSTSSGTKRKVTLDVASPSSKRTKTSDRHLARNGAASSTEGMGGVEGYNSESPGRVDPSSPESPMKHKVRIGKVEYPAHPYTVRVTNLSTDTEDMDLVDTLRPKCGAIVHAKIVRAKGHHGKGASKGWGLVQFEERSSVEKALGLSGQLGIREKLVKVDRSHMSAVGIVPPGMHRVRAEGEGKYSRRNKAKKDTGKADSPPVQGSKADSMEDDQHSHIANADKPIDNSGILAFRPRGVGLGRGRRKVNVTLSISKRDGKSA